MVGGMRSASTIQAEITAAQTAKTNVLSGAQSVSVQGRTITIASLQVINDIIYQLTRELEIAVGVGAGAPGGRMFATMDNLGVGRL